MQRNYLFSTTEFKNKAFQGQKIFDVESKVFYMLQVLNLENVKKPFKFYHFKKVQLA